MKSLIDRERVLDAFKERTRKNLGNRRLAVMREADLDDFVDTVVISNTDEVTGGDEGAPARGAPSRPTRPALRK
jgi:hypothetical protein